MQRVGINGVFSEWARVESGVPQGSILGPLLFNIFIMDINKKLKNKIIKFADDTKLWGKADTPEDIEGIREDLLELSTWSKENKMPFNVSKCRVMYMGKKNNREPYNLLGEKIVETNEEKDLGVFFTENFKPTTNCNKAFNSASRVIGLIRRNILSKEESSMLILYKTLVRPILEYCIPVWCPYRKNDIMKIEKIQKRFTKIIEGCKGLSYEERLKKLKLTTLEERRHRADLIQVFKIINDKAKTYPEDFFTFSERMGRINSMKMYKKRVNSDLGKYSFIFRVVDPWNALPNEIVTAKDEFSFKNKLDYYLRGGRGHT